MNGLLGGWIINEGEGEREREKRRGRKGEGKLENAKKNHM
jgi:hypothetical protein